MIPTFADHFSGVAGAYAEHRPRYPERLFAWLSSLVPRHEIAWDCATGNGQAAVALAPYFARVVATDASAAQIAAAYSDERVEYRVAPAEASGLAGKSIDLVTVGQALHWFDRAAFFAEARRVLRSDGVIAAWTYGATEFDDPRLDAAHRAFYVDTVGPFWPAERSLVETGYRNIEFPFEEIEVPSFEMVTLWPLATFIGYVGTWSAVTRFRAERGVDPVPDLARDLGAAWGDPEIPRRIRWPLAMRVGRAA
jgi:SAM-dependent methyltransferase